MASAFQLEDLALVRILSVLSYASVLHALSCLVGLEASDIDTEASGAFSPSKVK
jgi:hypothetical protein